MKSPAPDKIRNVAVIAHGGAGKTTLAEAVLFAGGGLARMGSVHDGTSAMDYAENEKRRQISINLGVGHCDWHGVKLNILDCPGYADFYGDVRAGLRVADGAVVVVSAPAGVEVGTELVWQHLERHGVPRIIAISKLDKEHADFRGCLEACADTLRARLAPVIVPIGAAEKLRGVVDLIEQKAYITDASGVAKKQDIPADMADEVAEWRTRLVEAAAESKEELMEKFFSEQPLSADEIMAGLRAGVRQATVVPVVAVSAPSKIGVEPLMSLIVGVMPSPADVGPAVGTKPRSDTKEERTCDPNGPFAGFVFKTVAEQHVGELSFLRVYSGTVSAGNDALNSTQDEGERMGPIHAMTGRERKEMESVSAGDIAAVVKLKNTSTGDTLCAKNAPIVFPGIEFPKPVLSVAVRAKAKADEEKINSGLNKLHEEDPTFTTGFDPVIRQTIISGLGDLHIDVMIEKLKDKFGVEVETEKPKIAYRETLKGKAEAEGKYKKQSGGRGQFGVAWLRVEARERGAGFEFVDEIVGGSISQKFIPAVEKGVVERMSRGVIAGYPVVDVRVAVYDGKMHPVDSSEMAFKMAGSLGFKEAAAQAKPVLLEPIYVLTVKMPDEFMGDVMSDISSRRGRIRETGQEGRYQIVKANVPLSELYKYSTHLRSITGGRGFCEQEFSHYEEAPPDVQAKVVAEAGKQEEEE